MCARWRGGVLIGLAILLITGCEGMELESVQTSPLIAATLSPLSTPAPVPSQALPPPPPETPTPPSTNTVPFTTPTVPTPQPMTPYPTRPPQAQAAVEAARAFLAEYLGIGVEQVGLVYVEPAEWPDTSLGCPEPGRVYAQVITPGYCVVLQVRNQQYELHTDRSGKQVVLCPGPVPRERVPLRRARSQEEIVTLARQHLAERLDVPLEAVEVVTVEEEWWDDDTLGCPRPPGNYPDRAYPGPIPGYRIVLAVEGVQYEYRSGRRWLLFCGIVRG